ncbi:MAG: glycosyltransferase [Odoribacter sp.]
MIPKIIHYCWFGKGEMSLEIQKCIHSWHSYLPDYQLMLWNEDNLPSHTPFLKLLFKYKKWALISDYIRLYALYNYGGIYFDTDIEVIQSFDQLQNEKCFIGFQQESLIKHPLNGAVMGCIAKHHFIKTCLLYMTRSFYKDLKPVIGPWTVSEVCKQFGLKEYGEQYTEDIKILTKEVFYPYHWEESFTPQCIQPNTLTIHRWQYSWKRHRNFKTLRKSAAYKIERGWFIIKASIFKTPIEYAS